MGLRTFDDPAVLEFAAVEGRILLTHDVATMVTYAYERVAAGLPMPGVIEIPEVLPLSAVLEDLLLICQTSRPDDWSGRVTFLPL